jgi:hypothetical protein
MLTFKQVNVLGNIFNSTWGKSVDDTYRCKANLEDDKLIVKYTTMVYFAGETGMRSQMPRLVDESNVRIKDLVKATKKEFADSTGDSLTLKELYNTDAVDLVQASSNNPRRVAYYKRTAVFQVG